MIAEDEVTRLREELIEKLQECNRLLKLENEALARRLEERSRPQAVSPSEITVSLQK